MSTLQCPATLLLARAGAPQRLVATLTGRRVARVWCGPDDDGARTAAEVAGALGVGVTPDPDPDVDTLLGTVADAHPGETVLLVVTDAALDDLARVCRMEATAGPLAPGATVEVHADADDRVCVRWG